MRFHLVVLAAVCLLGAIEAKTKKRLTEDEASPTLTKTKRRIVEDSPPKAIIAFQIVDPSDSKSSSRNSKRTIDNSLGYGYQSFVGATHQQPKFEIYKYSQHDIPPYKGASQYSGEYEQSYSKYSKPHHQQSNYQPGTTIYSTINQQGQLGDLSSRAPNKYNNHHSQVPVIILKVLPSQIADASHGLYPKLPQSHPQAQYLNSIDIQSLLSNYLQEMQQYYQQQDYQQPHYQYQPQQPKYVPQPAIQEFHYPPEYHQEQPQQSHYEHQQSNVKYYSQPQPPIYEPQYVQQTHQSTNGLLTHENYPANTHTKVIFKDHKGKVKTAQSQDSIKTKTIKIHVPSNIQGIEVQSSIRQPEPQYQYSNDDQNQNYYYYNQGPTEEQNYEQQPEQVVYENIPANYKEQAVQYEQPPQQYMENNYSQPSNDYVDSQDYSPPQKSHHTHQKRKQRSKKNGDSTTKKPAKN